MDFGQGLSDAWASIITFVPKLLMFLVILFIGWLLAKALAKAVDFGLEKVGFDRAVERGGIKRMLDRGKYDASDIIAKIVYYAILLIALQLAFGVFGPNPVSELLTAVVAWLPKAIVAIIIIVVASAIATGVKDLINNMLGGLSYGRLLGTIASVFILGLGVIAALNQIGVATAVTLPILITVLATVGGILIVGVGGGLIKPMQNRWDGWLNRAEQEIPKMRDEAAATAPRQGAPSQSQSGVPASSHVPAGAVDPSAPTTPIPPTGAPPMPPSSGYRRG